MSITEKPKETGNPNLAVAKPFQSGCGGGDFRRFLAFAPALGELASAMPYGADEFPIMIRSGGGDDFVAWGLDGVGLQQFLKRAFGVLYLGQLIHVIEQTLELLHDGGAGAILAAIQVDRANHGFKRIRQNGWTVTSAIGLFAAAHDEILTQAEMLGTFGEGSLIHQPGATFGEGTFIRLGEAVIKFTSEAKLKHSIPEELQPLVMLHIAHFVGHGGMGQCKTKQFRLAEFVAQVGFQLFVRAQVMWGIRTQLGP